MGQLWRAVRALVSVVAALPRHGGCGGCGGWVDASYEYGWGAAVAGAFPESLRGAYEDLALILGARATRPWWL